MSAIRGKEWIDVSKQLDIVLEKIFPCEEYKNKLSQYEKRKEVFEYLKDKIKYDNHLFNKIQKCKADRNISKEMFSVIENNTGISNGIAQAYKLLLDRLGIYSLVVFCSLNYGKDNIGSLIKLVENPNDIKAVKKFLDLTDKKGINVNDHMFNLVRNIDGTFSFDDTTFAILSKEKSEKFFDYDIIKAYELGQNKIKGMPSIILNINIGKNESLIEEKIAEAKLNYETLVPLPKYIISQKSPYKNF